VWKSHWKLLLDPFDGFSVPYVAVPPHEEAVARLVDTVETGRRRAVVRSAAGLGKSTVLARALAETRNPSRRVVRVSSAVDGAGLFAGLAGALGRPVPPGANRGLGWRLLKDAVRLCRWQHLRVVLAIDDCQHLTERADRLDLDRLVHLDAHPESRLTVLQAFRSDEGDEPATWPATSPGELLIRLPALTRGDAERYLTAKLTAAGRAGATFTPRALSRLHAASAGNPRTLDRLASLALMAGALRGLEIVTPDVIEGVARECTLDPLVPWS
jgi:type II secretory pathway predicted ATPase ExeA